MVADALDPEQVQARLAEFRRADPGLEAFGASTHRYTLGPPLLEAEVRRLEERFGITLPADYRQFVTQVGDGGAGPAYGLARLASLLSPGFSAAPFLPPTTYAEYADEGAEVPQDGILELCHHGCGYYDGLVVSGPEAGHMFGLGHLTWSPLLPDYEQLWREELRDHERALRRVYADFSRWPRHTFGSWYAAWLWGWHPGRWFEEERERRARRERRRLLPPLTPPVSLLGAALTSGEASVEERRRAVHALWQSGDPEAVPPLTAALRDEDEHVRVTAIQALARLGPLARPAVPALLDLLATSEDYLTATNALKALPVIDLAAARPALIGATRHPRPMIRFDAANALGQHGDASALPALRELAHDRTLPRESSSATVLTVGEAAGRALRAIRRRAP